MNKKFSKLMLTSASALALLAAYPSVASTAEVVGLDLPAITAEAATQGNAFIRVVRALPSAKNIKASDATKVRAARNLYNSLPAAEKENAGVVRWAKYLAEKEAALPVDHVANFIAESRALPNVREINAMDASEFAQAKVNLQAARSSYAKLTSSQKADTDVARWAGYLTVKEDAFGITFILEAKALPSVRRINEMNEDQLAVLAEDIASVRELYEALSPTAKADAEVASWNGYVDQKEEAAEGEDVVVDLEEVKATKTAEIEAVVLSEEDTAGKTEESIALAEAKLTELKEAALEAVEAAETEEEVEAVEVDTADALALLEDVVEDEELVVESVSAITEDGVTVEVKAAAEDMDDVNVEVLDNEGNVVATKAELIAEGQTEVTFDFVTPFAADYEFEGVWSVEGVEYNFDAVNQFDAIMDAVAGNNEVELLGALKAAGIENMDEDLISDYLAAIVADNDAEDLADIQEIIKEANEDAGTTVDEKAAVKAVEDADNQVQLLNAPSANFDRVNKDWIVEYAKTLLENKVDGKLLADYDTFDEIQDEIDRVNRVEIGKEDALANTAAKQAAVTALIETWMKPDNPETPKNTPKADDIEDSKLAEAAYKVREANTATRTYNALVIFADLAEDEAADVKIVVKDFKEENKEYYFDALKLFLDADNKDHTFNAEVTENPLQIVVLGNQLASDAKDAINERVINTEVSANYLYDGGEDLGHIKGYKANFRLDHTDETVGYVSDAEDQFTMSDLSKVEVNLYKDKTLLATVTSNKVLENYPDAFQVSAPFDVYGDWVYDADTHVKGINWTYSGWNGKITDVPTKVEYVITFKDGNVATIEDETINGADGIWTSNLQDAQNQLLVDDINEAETAEEVKVALDGLANEGAVDGYLNVTAADRIFIAEQVLDARDDLKAYAEDTDRNAEAVAKEYYNTDEVEDEVTDAVETRTGTLIAVNALELNDELTEIADVLLLVGHDSLTGTAGSVTLDGSVTPGTPTANDTAIADAFITAQTFADEEDDVTIYPNYRSIAAVRAAIDAVVAE